MSFQTLLPPAGYAHAFNLPSGRTVQHLCCHVLDCGREDGFVNLSELVPLPNHFHENSNSSVITLCYFNCIIKRIEVIVINYVLCPHVGTKTTAKDNDKKAPSFYIQNRMEKIIYFNCTQVTTT